MFNLRFQQVKSVTTMRDAVANHTKRRGYSDRLGGGCFGEVFGSAKDKARVVKLTFGSDPGYVGFIKELSKIGKNPFAPEIYSADVFMDDNGNTATRIFMERLEQPWHKNGHAVEPEWRAYVQKLDQIKLHVKGIQPRRWITENKYLSEMVDVIRRAAKATNTGIDLHSGNFMIRTGGQLVITDPLGFERLIGRGQAYTWEKFPQ